VTSSFSPRDAVELLILTRAGTTDLGRGAVVAFHPEAWPAAEAARLLQALQAGRSLTCRQS